MKTIFEAMTHNDNVKLMSGLEVLKVKRFKGHDGEELSQGILALNGVELGLIGEDAWSGPLNIHIDDEMLKPIEEFIEKNKFTYTYRNIEDKIDLEFYLTTVLQAEELKQKVKRSRKKTFVIEVGDDEVKAYPYAWDEKFIAHYNKKLRNDKEIVLNELI